MIVGVMTGTSRAQERQTRRNSNELLQLPNGVVTNSYWGLSREGVRRLSVQRRSEIKSFW
jgi:hypothetical protein